jgi:hypothetical protein
LGIGASASSGTGDCIGCAAAPGSPLPQGSMPRRACRGQAGRWGKPASTYAPIGPMPPPDMSLSCSLLPGRSAQIALAGWGLQPARRRLPPRSIPFGKGGGPGSAPAGTASSGALWPGLPRPLMSCGPAPPANSQIHWCWGPVQRRRARACRRHRSHPCPFHHRHSHLAQGITQHGPHGAPSMPMRLRGSKGSLRRAIQPGILRGIPNRHPARHGAVRLVLNIAGAVAGPVLSNKAIPVSGVAGPVCGRKVKLPSVEPQQAHECQHSQDQMTGQSLTTASTCKLEQMLDDCRASC